MDQQFNDYKNIKHLVPSNYATYKKQMLTFLKTRALEEHIIYDNFASMYKIVSPMTRYEATLRKKYSDVSKKVVTEDYDQDKKDAEMLKYEEKLAPFGTS